MFDLLLMSTFLMPGEENLSLSESQATLPATKGINIYRN